MFPSIQSNLTLIPQCYRSRNVYCRLTPLAPDGKTLAAKGLLVTIRTTGKAAIYSLMPNVAT